MQTRPSWRDRATPWLAKPLLHFGNRRNAAAAHPFVVDHQARRGHQVVSQDGLHVGDLDEVGLQAALAGRWRRRSQASVAPSTANRTATASARRSQYKPYTQAPYIHPVQMLK
jgi:hypothetical protein